MNHGKPRLARGIVDFDNNLSTVYFYINQKCEPPVGYTNGRRLGWTTAEIAFWNNIYARWVPLMTAWISKAAKRTTAITDSLKALIVEARTFEKLHHLYDRIAVCPNATIDDFKIFNIVRNTILAASTNTQVPDPGTKEVVIALRKMGHLYHQLLVTTTNKKGRGKEKGVKEIMIFKAITGAKDEAPDFELFTYAGDVSNGSVHVNHASGNEGNKAWFVARIKNSRGKIGVVSTPVGFIIV